MPNIENKLRLCESPDEDPLDFCEPVNCFIKYQGYKSIYDLTKRQCVTIPICKEERKTSLSRYLVIIYKFQYKKIVLNIL